MTKVNRIDKKFGVSAPYLRVDAKLPPKTFVSMMPCFVYLIYHLKINPVIN